MERKDNCQDADDGDGDVMEAVPLSIEIRCRLSTTYQLPDCNTDTMLMLKYVMMMLMSKRPGGWMDENERAMPLQNTVTFGEAQNSYKGVEVLTSEPRVRRICRILWKFILSGPALLIRSPSGFGWV